MKATARQRVLNYVRQHSGASAAQIAGGLGMKPPAVRHHLAVLRSDGRIVAGAGGAKRIPGRRALSYRVSERLMGDSLAFLADALLAALAKGVPSARGALVTALAESLAKRVGRGDASAGTSSRLAHLTAALNTLHYKARWEAGAQGPRILFGHCPYAAIIEDHPELCQMDTRAVSQVMGATAVQTAKIDPKGGKAAHCILLLDGNRGERAENATTR